MGVYERLLLPKIIDFACSTKPNMRQRAKVVPLASGSVLEVGFGSGLNLPFYDSTRVQHVWALDPSAHMWAMPEERAHAADFSVEFVKAPAEEIPLAAERADAVVVTYTLCTLPDVRRALRELARVLKPGGELAFCEHGVAPEESVRRWQGRLNPVWSALGGGCNLNRPIPSLIEDGGFEYTNCSRCAFRVGDPRASTTGAAPFAYSLPSKIPRSPAVVLSNEGMKTDETSRLLDSAGFAAHPRCYPGELGAVPWTWLVARPTRSAHERPMK